MVSLIKHSVFAVWQGSNVGYEHESVSLTSLSIHVSLMGLLGGCHETMSLASLLPVPGIW